MVACAFCGAEVQGNYREVTGWERVRRKGGGLHALIHRRETGRHACDWCGFDLVHGIAPGSQPRLISIDELQRAVEGTE
jgi:ribosomal protein L34E